MCSRRRPSRSTPGSRSRSSSWRSTSSATDFATRSIHGVVANIGSPRQGRITMKTADVAKRTKYEGYKSFDYLEPGTDYRAFKLAKEVARVPSRKVEVNDSQEERVWRLLDAKLAVSLHDHCFIVPEDFAHLAEYRRQGRDFTGYAGMAQSGLDAVFDCLMDGTATITSKAGWKWDDIIYDLGMRLSDIAHQDFI